MQTILRKFEEQFQIRALELEYAILLHLFERRQEASRKLQDACGYSRTRFHVALRVLEERGLVACAPGTADLRIKLYSLTPSCRAALNDLYAAMPAWISGKLAGSLVSGVMPRFTRDLKNRLGVAHASCAYEILLHLYDAPDQTVTDLVSHASYARCTLSPTLARLTQQGLVVMRPDDHDTRFLRCRLAPATADFMDRQHALLLGWFHANLDM